DEGLLPINTQADVSHEGVAADVAGEYHEALDGAGVTASSAYATPSMRGVLRASMQELMSGTLNVDNFLETVQTEWKNYQEGPGAGAAHAPAAGVGPPLVPDNGGPAEKVCGWSLRLRWRTHLCPVRLVVARRRGRKVESWPRAGPLGGRQASPDVEGVVGEYHLVELGGAARKAVGARLHAHLTGRGPGTYRCAGDTPPSADHVVLGRLAR